MQCMAAFGACRELAAIERGTDRAGSCDRMWSKSPCYVDFCSGDRGAAAQAHATDVDSLWMDPEVRCVSES